MHDHRLGERIDAALRGHGGGGALDFEGSASAIAKAEQVLETVGRESFDIDNAVFVSIGGADGGEVCHLLERTPARHGILLEFDDRLSDKAKERANKLRESHGKELRVFTGDALQKLELALGTIDKWRDDGQVASVVATMHAVLHELPDRGSGTKDIERILQPFLWRKLPVLMVAREPCMPLGLPPTVYMSAKCRPSQLAELATRIREAHVEFQSDEAPRAMADRVRMGSRLAVETIVKLFYIEALPYELNERVTSFSADDLLTAFRNVFTTGYVHHEQLQSTSFDQLWRELGIVLHDEHHTELAKPQVHIRIVATWRPPSDTAMGATGEEGPLGQEHHEHAAHDGVSDVRLGSRYDGPPGGLQTSATTRHTGYQASGDVGPPVDLWTPGPTKVELIGRYEPVVGSQTAERLWELSQSAIRAVGAGDFAAQVRLGRDLDGMAGADAYLQGEAAYFSAEGLRLLADVERDTSRRAELRTNAMALYEHASGLLSDDPRPLRGIGRVLEVQGDYRSALEHFQRAKGLCLLGLSVADPASRPDLAHEVLRTTRHLIGCILDIRRTNPSSQWQRENKLRELEGYLVECENYHRQLLPAFRSDQAWWLIEWFMGLVFIAKAWGEIGAPSRMRDALVWALAARRRLMSSADRPLSEVERSNLRWWVSVARERMAVFDSRSWDMVSQLTDAVDRGESSAACKLVDDLLQSMMPPWEPSPGT